MRVEELLRARALLSDGRVALAGGRARSSFAELDQKSDRLAGVLAAHRIRAGDRVALLMDNSPESVVTAFAVLKAGAILCFADATCDAAGLARFLVATRAVALATEARHASVAAAALAGAEGVRLVVLAGGDRTAAAASCISYEEAVGGFAAAPRPAAGDPSMTAAIFMTDERGGRVVCSHAALVEAAEAADIDENALVVASAPIASPAGLIRVLAAVYAGATQTFGGAARHVDDAHRTAAGVLPSLLYAGQGGPARWTT